MIQIYLFSVGYSWNEKKLQKMTIVKPNRSDQIEDLVSFPLQYICKKLDLNIWKMAYEAMHVHVHYIIQQQKIA